MMKRIIKAFLNFIQKIKSFLLLKRNKVVFKNTPNIYGKIYIKNNGVICIGKNVVINSSIRSNCTSGLRTCIHTTRGATLTISDNTGISNARIIATENIEIGKDVLIGAGCCIYDTDFHPLIYRDRISHNNEKIKHSPVVIEDGVFIGANVIILKGVIIGRHSIIGAGSVVTKNVPAGQIWAGNPAKYIRDVIEDESISD